MNGCYVSCEHATRYFFGELIITEELVILIVTNFFAQKRKLEQLQQLAVCLVHLSIAMAEAACELQSSLPRSFSQMKHMPAPETVIISI